jgi:hypothetical protein
MNIHKFKQVTNKIKRAETLKMLERYGLVNGYYHLTSELENEMSNLKLSKTDIQNALQRGVEIKGIFFNRCNELYRISNAKNEAIENMLRRSERLDTPKAKKKIDAYHKAMDKAKAEYMRARKKWKAEVTKY